MRADEREPVRAEAWESRAFRPRDRSLRGRGVEALVAWIGWLRAHAKRNHKVGTIGWCFGGGWSLNASLATPVDATVIYYGNVSKTADELAARARAPPCEIPGLMHIRQARVYGLRPKRIFRQAATKYLNESQHKRRIADEAMHLKQLDAFIGDLPLEAIHAGTLRPFVEARLAAGRKTKSINLALGVVRHLLNLAASQWLDEQNLTWLQVAPKVKLLSVTDERKAYPLSWEEQDRLFKALPVHLARMALFKVNTGLRDQEVCRLRWSWELSVPELATSVFVPRDYVKNAEDRPVVLNRVATSVIEEVRGQHPAFVFTFRGRPVRKMNNSGWKAARKRAGLPHVRVHDLKHSSGTPIIPATDDKVVYFPGDRVIADA